MAEATYTTESLQEKTKKIISDLTGATIPELKPETTFDDMHMDSLDQVELILKLEKEFDISITDSEWEIQKNVDMIMTLVEQKVANK